MIQSNYQKYIILSAPRSGTNYLVHLLGSHPNIQSYGEPFQPDYLFGNPKKTAFENPLIDTCYRRYRNTVPLFFLRSLIFRPYPRHIRAVGFKIFYEHCANGNLRQVWPYLAHMPNLKIIHVYRQNLLKSFVSRKIAEMTGHYISFEKVSPHHHVTISLHYNECLKYFRTMERWREHAETYFRNSASLPVIYEHLTHRPHAELARIQRFLTVPEQHLRCNVFKQNTAPLEKVITNFPYLKRKFSGTRYAAYFHDKDNPSI